MHIQFAFGFGTQKHNRFGNECYDTPTAKLAEERKWEMRRADGLFKANKNHSIPDKIININNYHFVYGK